MWEEKLMNGLIVLVVLLFVVGLPCAIVYRVTSENKAVSGDPDYQGNVTNVEYLSKGGFGGREKTVVWFGNTSFIQYGHVGYEIGAEYKIWLYRDFIERREKVEING